MKNSSPPRRRTRAGQRAAQDAEKRPFSCTVKEGQKKFRSKRVRNTHLAEVHGKGRSFSCLEEGCPVALFEPADPTKRAMYCKDKVYQGATEFSFEELQANRWKRQEKIRLEKEEMERKRLELLEMEQRMDRKMEEMQRLMALQQNVAAAAAQAPALCQPGLPKPNSSRVNDPSLALRSRDDLTPSASCESSLSTSSSASLQRKHSMDDTAYLMAANPTGARNRSQGRTPRYTRVLNYHFLDLTYQIKLFQPTWEQGTLLEPAKSYC